MKTIGFYICFAIFAVVIIAAGIKSHDNRCYRSGGHWTAHGFGFCVDKNGNYVKEK